MEGEGSKGSLSLVLGGGNEEMEGGGGVFFPAGVNSPTGTYSVGRTDGK